MNVILFNPNHKRYLPLTYTKPFGELRMGILTFKERWEKLLDTKVSYKTENYLSEKFSIHLEEMNLYINSVFFPNQDLVFQIQKLEKGEFLFYNEDLVAAYISEEDFELKQFKAKKEISDLLKIEYTWDLFLNNHHAIQYDFDLLTNGRESNPIPKETRVKGDKKRVFIEDGAKIDYAILNVENGPIYLGKDSEVMEGSMIRGGLALCEGAKLNMGAKIYGGTTIGPYSKVGGEVNNSILTAYSSKGHEGFLGNSVLGEWCNLGADTNNSNLKNNYASVKMWSYERETYINTGLQFCGLVMGDHSKSAINTQFNTGTTVGVAANIFESGFLPNLVNSFSWGGGRNEPKFKLEKCFETAKIVMQRREKELTEVDKNVLTYLYELG